jgi:hypothetical protein
MVDLHTPLAEPAFALLLLLLLLLLYESEEPGLNNLPATCLMWHCLKWYCLKLTEPTG